MKLMKQTGPWVKSEYTTCARKSIHLHQPENMVCRLITVFQSEVWLITHPLTPNSTIVTTEQVKYIKCTLIPELNRHCFSAEVVVGQKKHNVGGRAVTVGCICLLWTAEHHQRVTWSRHLHSVSWPICAQNHRSVAPTGSSSHTKAWGLWYSNDTGERNALSWGERYATTRVATVCNTTASLLSGFDLSDVRIRLL